ncbi:MAG TPA: bifunctional glutamate N-acetyltransferase/amino-acid acetyltransferase ArgJ, partial [Dehalococcoidia bacterium]|nr:bifunctional glutamate N-acetyltransferase/amino-acid acetyltransferase ArgJ [Dehalococcoidia bacterium]
MSEPTVVGQGALAVVPGGHVTTPKGFLAGAVYAGIKTYGEEKLDLAILYSIAPCAAVAMFTTNAVKGAPLIVTRDHLRAARPRALVVNAGVANVATGREGLADAEEMCRLVAAKLDLAPEEVLVASTGVIGKRLPMERIRHGIADIGVTEDGGERFAHAIMTTDTRPKTACVRVTAGAREHVIGGVAKGAGMIHPNMATMFAFVTTDAPVEPAFLDRAFRQAVDDTLNMVSVDGDTSTSDMALILANGVAGGSPLDGFGPASEAFAAGLREVLTSLARQIARDGEGATRLLTVRVEGAASREDARAAARAVTASPLVKAAVWGRDPNWGRMLMAVGRSGARID